MWQQGLLVQKVGKLRKAGSLLSGIGDLVKDDMENMLCPHSYSKACPQVLDSSGRKLRKKALHGKPGVPSQTRLVCTRLMKYKQPVCSGS